MATFKAIILKHHIKPDKTVRVKILVTHNRQKAYIDTGLICTTSDLNKKLELKNPAFIDATTDLIRKFRAKCNECPQEIALMGIDQLREYLTAQDQEPLLDFIAFGHRHADKLKKEGRKRTAEDYITIINALQRFTKKDRLPVSLINLNFLLEFQNWIMYNPLQKKAKVTMTRAPLKYLEGVRALHNEMKRYYNDESRGVIRIPFSPFSKFKFPRRQSTRKRALSPFDLIRIFSLSERPVKNSKGTNRFNLAKDCYMLSFYLIGMNSADIYDCSQIRKDTLVYFRKKTRSRRVDKAEIHVDVNPEIKDIMSKYRDPSGKKVFNFYSYYSTESTFNKAINQGLKQIGKELGIEDLEFYSARHSWATIAINRVGIDKFTVHEALNHVSDQMKITDIYIDKDWSVINNANRKVIDYLNGLKEKSAPG